MTTTRPAWVYTLPAALLLMAPFDILASLAMDIYLPVVPAMPGILNTTPAMIQLTLSLYMVMLGVGKVILVALRQNRATANSTCGRNGFRHCVSGSSLVFNCTGLCRFPSTSSSGRVGHAGGDVRDGSRRLCQPS